MPTVTACRGNWCTPSSRSNRPGSRTRFPPKGAAGLMQLMPATAVTFGVRNRFRMEENVQGGVAYLAWLQQRFRGDLRLVTAAYFAGENAIASHGLSYSSPRSVPLCQSGGTHLSPQADGGDSGRALKGGLGI